MRPVSNARTEGERSHSDHSSGSVILFPSQPSRVAAPPSSTSTPPTSNSTTRMSCRLSELSFRDAPLAKYRARHGELGPHLLPGGVLELDATQAGGPQLDALGAAH